MSMDAVICVLYRNAHTFLSFVFAQLHMSMNIINLALTLLLVCPRATSRYPHPTSLLPSLPLSLSLSLSSLPPITIRSLLGLPFQPWFHRVSEV